MFKVNEIVKGKVCGTFIVVDFKVFGGEQYVKVKAINPETMETAKGHILFPVDALLPM